MQCASANITYIKKELSGETKVVNKPNIPFLNEELGVMPIVAPYIKEKIKELDEYKRLIKENFLVDIPTIAVEGITDKNIWSVQSACIAQF